MPLPSGPREWMPGPKNWKTFDIDTNGHVFLDGKEIGMANRADFRMTREMRKVLDLWQEADEAFYRSEMKDGPTFPVRAHLYSKQPPGMLMVQVDWQTENHWPEVEEMIRDLQDSGFLMEARKPTMWVGAWSIEDYWKVVRKIRRMAKERGLTHYLPLYSAEIKEIVEWMARTIFVLKWADRQEEKGITYPGQELFEVAPRTSKDAKIGAWALVEDLQEANKLSIFEIYDQALQRAKLENTAKNREEFGYLVAMEAMGTGIALEEDFPDHGLEIPEREFMI